MLVLPELDTYNVIPRYARHPDDQSLLAAFALLMERARRHLVWSTHDLLMNGASFDAVMRLRMGRLSAKPDKPRTQTMEQLANATDKERMDWYMKTVKAAGFDIDPAVFMNKKGSESAAADEQ